MHRRRPSSRERRHIFIRALQTVRLNGLATGDYEPLTDREHMYLELLRRGRAPDIEDFILSEPLLLLESMTEPDRGPDVPVAQGHAP